MSSKKQGQPEPKPAWGMPEIANCRASSFGGSDIVFCLEDDPHNCSYALSFGSSYFCLHPKRLEIVARTRVAKNR